LNQNRLEHIPAGLDQLISIRTLDLGENRISSFQTADFQNGGQVKKGANSKVFHKLSALYGLRLAGNRLEQIPSQIFQV
jgi:Leucine-rich repeat (LRR) protein